MEIAIKLLFFFPFPFQIVSVAEEYSERKMNDLIASLVNGNS